METTFQFSRQATRFYFDSTIAQLTQIVGSDAMVIITDTNVFAAHKNQIEPFKHIVIPAGEMHKTQTTADAIIQQLIDLEVDRSCTLIGVGGGVVTDIAGYVASVYMRGLRFGFVPTSILALVDASIGGKNGVDVKAYKNLVGTINQPDFILHDLSLLQTLPQEDWINGFAEIIKHACILDAAMFEQLESNNLTFYQSNIEALAQLIHKNVLLKCSIVQEDEFEKGNRKLLNYGHTLGHAIENTYNLMHGEAIAIGMVFANYVSVDQLGFNGSAAIEALLQKYQLPTKLDFDAASILKYLVMDKKRAGQSIQYVLLESVGKARVQPISIVDIQSLLKQFENPTTKL